MSAPTKPLTATQRPPSDRPALLYVYEVFPTRLDKSLEQPNELFVTVRTQPSEHALPPPRPHSHNHSPPRGVTAPCQFCSYPFHRHKVDGRRRWITGECSCTWIGCSCHRRRRNLPLTDIHPPLMRRWRAVQVRCLSPIPLSHADVCRFAASLAIAVATPFRSAPGWCALATTSLWSPSCYSPSAISIPRAFRDDLGAGGTTLVPVCSLLGVPQIPLNPKIMKQFETYLSTAEETLKVGHTTLCGLGSRRYTLTEHAPTGGPAVGAGLACHHCQAISRGPRHSQRTGADGVGRTRQRTGDWHPGVRRSCVSPFHERLSGAMASSHPFDSQCAAVSRDPRQRGRLLYALLAV